jgi:hypothetical protein
LVQSSGFRLRVEGHRGRLLRVVFTDYTLHARVRPLHGRREVEDHPVEARGCPSVEALGFRI